MRVLKRKLSEKLVIARAKSLSRRLWIKQSFDRAPAFGRKFSSVSPYSRKQGRRNQREFPLICWRMAHVSKPLKLKGYSGHHLKTLNGIIIKTLV